MAPFIRVWLLIGTAIFFLASCGGGRPAAPLTADEEVLALPALAPAALDGRPLRVVATTSIIGDVLAQVGGDLIDLTVLIDPGQDPHGYAPTAADMTAVAVADLIVVNGWDLEEGLVGDLQTIGESAVFVPLSAGITPLFNGKAADPHVWFSVASVRRWTTNARDVFAAADPAHAAEFAGRADAYLAELAALERYVGEQVDRIPPDNRVLITNHDTLRYFAAEHQFEILGTIIPSVSTMAEPSASSLTGLVEAMNARGVCALFSENIVNETLIRTVAADVTACETVRVYQIATDALGTAGSGPTSYLELMRQLVDTIADGLVSPESGLRGVG